MEKQTLKEEIVEALRGARMANFYLPSIREEYDNLASKVESARCENCAHYESSEDEEGCSLVMVECQGPKFGCWNFEPNEKHNE